MANFIGKVRMAGEYAFQNKRGAEGNVSDPGPQVYEGDIYIPDIRTVDFSKFLKRYTYDDVNEERPFYFFQWQRQYGTTESIKLPMASDTKITFFYNDRLNDTVGMTVGDLNTYGLYNQHSGGYVDGNMYGYCYPFTSIGLTSETPIDRIYDPSCSWVYTAGGISRSDLLAKAAINNDNITGFIPKYDPNLDAYLIAGTTRTVNNISDRGYYFYDKNDRLSMYNNYTNYTTSRSQREMTGIEDKRYIRIGTNSSSGFTLVNNSGTQVTIKIPYLHKSYFTNEYFSLMIGDVLSMGTYALLRDSATGEYWIMIVNRDGFGSGGEINNYVILTQFRNCYTSIASSSNVDGTIAPAFRYVDESTFGNLDDFLTDLFSVQKEPSYEDEAPEAVGPGDPYDDDKLNNSGGIVGGNTNINVEIDNVDITPNLGYDDFVRSYGLFGTYNLTPDNLLNYTRTLTLLYENSVLPAEQEVGDKAKLMAELIKENTVSVNFLPFSIPDEECELVSFDIGTKTIRKATKFGQFILPEYDDKAKLIKQITGVYNIPIGTIPHYYDNFLDFAPYSSASLYIPYIGKVELPINLIQSTSENVRNLSLSFRIDRSDGDMVVILSSNNVPLCHWSGNCAKSLKLSIQDTGDLQKAQLKRTVGAIEAIAMGGYAAATGNAFIGLQAGLNMTSNLLQPGNISTAQHMIGNSPQVGDLGWMDMQKIVLTVERPIWWKPYDYGSLVGYPTKKIVKLSSLSGFSMIPEAHIKCNLNTEEINELQELLSKGVIF